jgi:hypothetical protein
MPKPRRAACGRAQKVRLRAVRLVWINRRRGRESRRRGLWASKSQPVCVQLPPEEPRSRTFSRPKQATREPARVVAGPTPRANCRRHSGQAPPNLISQIQKCLIRAPVEVRKSPSAARSSIWRVMRRRKSCHRRSSWRTCFGTMGMEPGKEYQRNWGCSTSATRRFSIHSRASLSFRRHWMPGGVRQHLSRTLCCGLLPSYQPRTAPKIPRTASGEKCARTEAMKSRSIGS